MASSFNPVGRSEKLHQTCQALGMDMAKDEEFLWIAEAAMDEPLDEEWKEFEDATGEPAFYHPRLKLLQTEHPVRGKFKAMFHRVKTMFEDMREGQVPKTNVATRLSVIINETMNRCHRGYPPVTPELVEKTCLLLGVNSSVQHSLARMVKMALDTFVERSYELATQVGAVPDSNDFLKLIREAQVELEVRRKPDDVVMCTEIPGKPADVKCEQCKDFFSFEGFRVTHATGKRRGHSTLSVQQKVCSVDPSQLATCEVNGVLYCDDAYEQVTRDDPELRKMPKKVLAGLSCSQYPKRASDVVCEECLDLFCWEGFIEIHRKGKRRFHTPLVFDAQGHLWRAGQIMPPEEAQTLVDRCRLIAQGGPWCAFRDDNLNTYWYHWQDKLTTTTSPFNP